LTSNGSNSSPTWAAPTTSAGSSSNTQLIYNSSGSLTGSSSLTYNGTNQLIVAGSPFTIAGHPNSSISITAGSFPNGGGGAVGQGGSINITGGASIYKQGGSVTITGGGGVLADVGLPSTGGDVTLKSGSGVSGNGSLYFNIVNTERLRIAPTGAWGLSGANYGTSGQVLTSNGSNSSPTWTTPGAPSSATIIAALGYTPVNVAGDTMTGALTLSGAPTSNLHAATKQYVDSVAGVGGFTGGIVANATTFSSEVTFSSTITFGTAYNESTVTINAVSTTTIDCSLSNNFIIQMGTNITNLTFTNVPASNRLFYVALIFRQDAAGGRTISWPASVKWQNGESQTLSTSANKLDVITLMTFDGGTSFLAFVAGKNY
jgi:hypothetical protein